MSALDEFIQNAKAAAILHGTIAIGPNKYAYDVLPKSFEPRVPYFVGYPEGRYLFISAEVPERFREAVFRHEIRCRRLQNSGDPDHCRHAAVYELVYVPSVDCKEYLDLRLKMFDALVELYAGSDNTSFVQAITASRDQFRMLVHQSSD